MFKMFKKNEFHDHIWNHYEKCIEISANMPSIGLEIPEITLWNFSIFKESRKVCAWKKKWPRAKCLKEREIKVK